MAFKRVSCSLDGPSGTEEVFWRTESLDRGSEKDMGKDEED